MISSIKIILILIFLVSNTKQDDETTSSRLKFTFDESNGGHLNTLDSLISLENGYIASSGSSEYEYGEIKIWDLEKNELNYTFNSLNGGHSDTIRILLLLKNGNLLASSSGGYKREASIKIWDLDKYILKFTFDKSNGGHTDLISKLIELENDRLASTSYDNLIKIWNLKTGMLDQTIEEANGGNLISPIYCSTLLSNYLITGSHKIKIWDTQSKPAVHWWTIDQSNGLSDEIHSINSVIKLSNGNLASAADNIKIWNIHDYGNELKFTFDKSNGGHLNEVNHLVELENGYMASSSIDGGFISGIPIIKIWDLSLFKLKFTFDSNNGGHSSFVRVMASLNNGYLATGSQHQIAIWDITDGKRKINFDGQLLCSPNNCGNSMAIDKLVSLEYGFMASGSTDGTIKIWDLN